MSAQPRSRSFPWVPLGLVGGAVAIVLGLAFFSSTIQSGAQAAPPKAVAGIKTDGTVVLSVRLPASKAGSLKVQLLGPEEKILAEEVVKVKATEEPTTHRIEFAAPRVAADKVTVRCRFGKQKADVALGKIMLVKAHETALNAGQEFFAGSTAALRCEVHGVKSLTETIPLPGALVEVSFVTKDGKSVEVFEGKAGKDGVAAAQFKVPALPPGSYKMKVTTKSALGEEKLERDVTVKHTPRVLLVTDKPLYQPGQVIHLRALALGAFDLAPIAAKEIVFEVEDAKGNKVFKKDLKTSAFGVAAADFQLASEVNNGEYRVRAILGEHQADKTVTVKPYVLPKFKTDVKADKRFYLPKETVNVDIQSDYFFGKPVAAGTVKVTASTFDVAFKDFFTWNGKTDANGHAKVEVKLPDYFVGQPLQSGNGIVKVEVKLTDTADHTETITRTYPVSDQPVRVTLIPEGGRLTPNVENRVFAAALYPDGSPAKCEVKLWDRDAGKEKPAAEAPGKPAQPLAPAFPGRIRGGPVAVAPQGQAEAPLPAWEKAKPLATVQTNDAGLAEFRFTPKAELFRPGQWANRNIEILGGQTRQQWGPKAVYDLMAEAKDGKGANATVTAALTSEPLGENVLLRLDKAVYNGGDLMNVEVRSSAGLPTVYIDVIKSGQTLLTSWLDVKDGKATQKFDLPPAAFGTLEVHAYQPLISGEIIRDSRVVYVNPASDLKIDVKADKDVYLPGDAGKIRFAVTDKDGKPQAAALGVLIVDEAVYALQEMQPGLEKVYFTLQEELLKPQAQVLQFKSAEPIDVLVREPILADAKQIAAEVLLTAVRPKPPARWEVNPALGRRERAEQQVTQVGWALFNVGQSQPVVEYDAKAKTTRFDAEVLAKTAKMYGWNEEALKDPFGQKLTLASLAKVEKGFTPQRLAVAITRQRIQNAVWPVIQYANQQRAKFFKDNKWNIPEDAVSEAVKAKLLAAQWEKDAWGRPFRVVYREKKLSHPWGGHTQMDHHEIVSAGPDGKFGTDDDVVLGPQEKWHLAQWWWLDGDRLTQAQQDAWGAMPGKGRAMRGLNMELARNRRGAEAEFAGALGGAGPLADGAPVAKLAAAAPPGAPVPEGGLAPQKQEAGAKPGTAAPAGTAPITRTREYFPETMLWQPALITDDKGKADLSLIFADSITTWRLTASASSRGGLLGGVTTPLRVFQDFFVDLDLPLNLTQNDEVAFPVAVYNYLKDPQTVKLDLQPEPWFELVDGQGLTRSLDLKPGEVTSVKYRIRAKKIGHFPLTVKASGTKMSDAIKRVIEVVPDGQKVEQVVSDRLAGKVSQTVTIPDNAIPDASKLFVKVYPGVFSQLVEGTEGMLRMPGGCFEQTSSSAYPNVLVVDYIKKNKLATPQVLLQAEQYLNGGYQRLLTFERPGGGFDWWGSGEPLVWLSAYGLHEFNDMAKAWPVDKGIINRTQAWLMKQREADGTWSKIGATHGESIERMGDPKLLLTSYVAWSLLESGLKTPELGKSIDYIREHAKTAENPYILALAANALASWDSKDDSTHEVLVKVLRKLDEKKQQRPEWKAICFPAGAEGHSLCYARGESLTVETTALAVLAMLKNGQFPNQTNQALIYIAKSKDSYGTWGSTQATILALKALVAASGGVKQKDTAAFTILVNGKEAAKGEVNEKNADVMQLFDLKEHVRPGANEVAVEVKGETNLAYQVVGRHFIPWQPKPQVEPLFAINVEYDRTKLSTSELLRAKATLKYNGKVPTSMVMLDLGIAPGFTVDAGDFAELVAAKKVNKFSITSRQVILYLGDVKPGQVQTIEYTLKPKYPIKAKTPATVAYEYYTPANRGEAKPVELVVEDKK